MTGFMLVVFGLMLGGLGIMLIVVGLREHFAQRRLLAMAVPVEAVILKAEVTSSRSMGTDQRLLRDNSTTSHTPEVRFAYTLGGIRYESDLLDPTVIHRAYASREHAAEEIEQYKLGAVVRAYANSSQPQRAFLRMQSSSNPKWFVGRRADARVLRRDRVLSLASRLNTTVRARASLSYTILDTALLVSGLFTRDFWSYRLRDPRFATKTSRRPLRFRTGHEIQALYAGM